MMQQRGRFPQRRACRRLAARTCSSPERRSCSSAAMKTGGLASISGFFSSSSSSSPLSPASSLLSPSLLESSSLLSCLSGVCDVLPGVLCWVPASAGLLDSFFLVGCRGRPEAGHQRWALESAVGFAPRSGSAAASFRAAALTATVQPSHSLSPW